MKKLVSLLITVAAFMPIIKTFAQKDRAITGFVKDSSGMPLPASTVKLTYGNNDSLLTTARADGRFIFKFTIGNNMALTVSATGYISVKKHYQLGDSAVINVGDILLPLQENMLNPVTVAAANAVTVKEDTVTYNMGAFKVRENAPLEDALKKMPGIDVDANGNVTAQGKQVSKVRVNGKDFFSGDVKTATRNLPADIVQNVQIIDDYGDQANLTGVKMGDPDKIMNITIRPDKNHGYTGQLIAGDGTDAVPAKPGISNNNRYLALLNAFSFNGDEQVAVLANINNTNANTFSFGTPSTTSPIEAKKLAAENMLTGKNITASAPSQANTQNGITNTHTAGFNYRNQWGKYLSVYGSYSFADNTTNTQSTVLQQNTSPTNPGQVMQASNETAHNINHRFNWNMEYRPDTVNYLKVTPSTSYASVNAMQAQTVDAMQKGSNTQYAANINSTLHSPSYSITALYNHRFNARGRNFSINVTANTSTTTQYQNPVYTYITGNSAAPLSQMINTYSQSQNYGFTLSYLEPLKQGHYLEFNYALNYSITNNNKQASVFDTASHGFVTDTALSNRYNFTFITNRFSLNYRYIKKTFNYTFGLAVEPSQLNGNTPLHNAQTHTNAVNIVPTAQLVLNPQRNHTLNFNYSGASSQPVFNQLQPVTDFSNALYPVQGNPSLKPQFSNSFTGRYNKFDLSTGNTFFTGAAFAQVQNQVVTNTVAYPRLYSPNPALQGTYLTRYENANGYYSASGFISFARPWHKRRYTLMLNANASYNNNVGFLTSVDSITYAETKVKNVARNIIFTPAARLRVDIPDVIDAQLQTSYSISKTNNSVRNSFTNIAANIRTLTIGVSGKNYFGKNWVLSYEYSKAFNYGYTVAVTNPNILNLYIERQFFKNSQLTARLAAYDVFNQNTGFSSTTSPSAITQTSVSRLGRYCLATLTWRFQRFGAPVK